MVLSGLEIKERLGNDIIISPFEIKQLNPNSYNLILHNELLIYSTKQLDMKIKNPSKRIIIPEEGFLIEPGKLYLGRTYEHTETYNLVPMIEGRSSVGRLGLFIHITAGFGDVGFKGYWTLEIFCVQPIKIYPNTEICQIYYHTISKKHCQYDKGKYQNNKDIQESKLYKEFK